MQTQNGMEAHSTRTHWDLEKDVPLPDGAMSQEETQEEFVRTENAYPLRGRPFGLAFVFACSYMDSRGTTQLELSIDSATMVAEVLQQSGYEVRTKMDSRKRYIMDELAVEQLTELKLHYDTVVVYFCGRGNGHAFYTQSHDEMITVEEIWQRFDEAGLKNKPRVVIMDLFELQSPAEEELLQELDILRGAVEGNREDIALMEERNVQAPQSLLDKVEQLEKQLEEKKAFREELRHPPAAGLTARIGVMKAPLGGGVARFRIRVKQLAYAIGFGVCDPEGLCRVHASGMKAYSGLHDFLGADQFGSGPRPEPTGPQPASGGGDGGRGRWGFNEIGRTHANEHGSSKGSKAAWQRRAHVRAGDEVEVTVDMAEGALRMEVQGKFKPADAVLLHPLLVNPQGRGAALHGAVALYGLGDEVEVEEVLVGETEGSLRPVPGPCWDPRRSAADLVMQGRCLRRTDGLGLTDHPDSLVLVHRQPFRIAPAAYNDRKQPVGEVGLGIYDAEAVEAGGVSLFAHFLSQRLRQAAAAPDASCALQDWLPAMLQRDLDRYALGTFVRHHCGLDGRAGEEAVAGLEGQGVGVHDLKRIADKAALEALGIHSRTALDAVFRGIQEARATASMSVQALQLFTKNTLQRKLLLNGPPLAWSRRHKAEGVSVSADGLTASKRGQTRGSCTVVCSLASQLRAPRKYTTVLAGGGRHAWDFTIDRLRSSQGEERGNPGSIRLGLVQAEGVLGGRYAVAVGQCRGGTTTTVVLDEGASEADGAYEGLFLLVLSGQGAGQSSRVFGYTGEDRTADVVLELPPDASSRYALTRLEGFEVGDDAGSWALSSSTAGRSAVMHGDVAQASYKAFQFQGAPSEVNRVTACGFEAEESFPRCLGEALAEGDTVTVWLDLDAQVLAVSLNGAALGQGVRGVHGTLLPALSCAAATDCQVTISNYRRWGPETGWAAQASLLALSEEEQGALRQSFRRLEDKGSGTIQTKRMRDLLSAVGVVMTDAEMADVLDSVDVDGSGSIDMMEFLDLMSSFKDKGQWSPDQMAALPARP